MISFEEAIEIIKGFALPLGTKRVNLFEALNKTLAEDIFTASPTSGGKLLDLGGNLLSLKATKLTSGNSPRIMATISSSFL